MGVWIDFVRWKRKVGKGNKGLRQGIGRQERRGERKGFGIDFLRQ